MDQDETVEICSVRITNPWLAGLTIILFIGAAGWYLWSFASDSYRAVDGIAISKRVGMDDDHFLTIEEAGGNKFEMRVSLDVYIHTEKGDRVTKEAGFFKRVHSEGVERYQKLREKLDELKKKHNIVPRGTSD